APAPFPEPRARFEPRALELRVPLAEPPHLALHPAAFHVKDRGPGDAERPALNDGKKASDEPEREENPAEREERDARGPAAPPREAARRALRLAHGFFGKTPRRASRAICLDSSEKLFEIIQSRNPGCFSATSSTVLPRCSLKANTISPSRQRNRLSGSANRPSGGREISCSAVTSRGRSV